jgi:hypothetical protein
MHLTWPVMCWLGLLVQTTLLKIRQALLERIEQLNDASRQRGINLEQTKQLAKGTISPFSLSHL